MATYVVTVTADEADGDLSAGDLSLREALALADANPGRDLVTFATALAGARILLDQGQLLATEEIVIDGDLDDDGLPDITLDAGGASRILEFDLPSPDGGDRSGLSGLVLTGGRTTAADGHGPAVLADHDLLLADSVVRGNRADGTGAIGSGVAATGPDGHLRLVNVVATDNAATGAAATGGALWGTRLDGINVTATGNTSAAPGGAGLGAEVLMVLRNATVTGNASAGGTAGGAGVRVEDGSLNLQNSIVLGNAAPGAAAPEIDGAALVITAATASIAGADMAAFDAAPFARIDNADPAEVFALTAEVRADLDGDGRAETPTGVTGGVTVTPFGGLPRAALSSRANNPAIDAGYGGSGITLEEAFFGVDVTRDGDTTDGPGISADVLPSDGRGAGYARVANAAPDLGAFEVQSPVQPRAIVDTAADVVDAGDGLTSLREAIALANATPGTDLVGFAPALSGQVLRLTQGEIAVTESLVLEARDVPFVRLSGDAAGDDLGFFGETDLPASSAAGRLGDNTRILVATGADTDLEIRGLTLAGGITRGDNDPSGATEAARSGESGGAIRAEGDLTLVDTRLIGNATYGSYATGGAVHVLGTLTVRGGAFTGNRSYGDYGGGGALSSVGPVDVSGAVLQGNEANGIFSPGGAALLLAGGRIADALVSGNRTTEIDSPGGAILASGPMTLVDTRLDTNFTEGADSPGGAISASLDAGGLVIHGGAIEQNGTRGDYSAGGAIRSQESVVLVGTFLQANTTTGYASSGGAVSSGDSVTAINASFLENATAGALSSGGAIHAPIRAALQSSTVTGNTVAGPGASGAAVATQVVVDVANSLVIGNTALQGATGLEVFSAGGIGGPGGPFVVFTAPSLVGAGPGEFVADATSTIIASGVDLVGNADPAAVFAATQFLFADANADGLPDTPTGLVAGDATFPAEFAGLATGAGNPARDSGDAAAAVRVFEGSFTDLDGDGSNLGVLALDEAVLGIDANRDGDFEDVFATVGDLPFDTRDTRGTVDEGTGFVRLAGPGLDIGAVEAQLTVTTALDVVDPEDGLTSLREAIAKAATLPVAATVDFAESLFGDTIRLTMGPVEVSGSQPLTIDGDRLGLGAAGVRISGDAAGDDPTDGFGATDIRAARDQGTLSDNTRIFEVTGAGGLTISGLSLTGGYTSGDGAALSDAAHVGGAIRSFAPLVVTGSQIVGNGTGGYAAPGGAVAALMGGLEIRETELSGNATFGDDAPGGAVFTTVETAFDGVEILGNLTEGDRSRGGGVAAVTPLGERLAIVASEISGNATFGEDAPGGGLSDTGFVEIVTSLVDANHTHGPRSDAGGIEARGFLDLVNTTVARNVTRGPDSDGGGIATREGNFVNATITGNAVVGAGSEGGGLAGTNTGGADFGFTNSIVLGNGAPLAGPGVQELAISSGDVFAGGGAILGANPAAFDPDPATNPLLAPFETDILNAAPGAVFAELAQTLSDSDDDLAGDTPTGVFGGALSDDGPGGIDGERAVAPLAVGSPAVDAGDASAPTGIDETRSGIDVTRDGDLDDADPQMQDLPTDPRGPVAPRIAGAGIDLGAAEGPTAPSEVFVVTTGADVVDPGDGLLSLREAVALANATPAFDTVIFAATAATDTVRLEQGEITVTAPLAIRGSRTGRDDAVITGDAAGNDVPTAEGLTDVDASRFGGGMSDNSRLFVFEAGAQGSRLEDVVLTGGYADDQLGGGAILTRGDLDIEESRISGNLSGNVDSGGAVRSLGAVTLAIEDSVLDANVSREDGGAISADIGTVTVSDSVISGNEAEGEGGGIHLAGDGSLLVTSASRISSNTGNLDTQFGGEGGGIYAGGTAIIAGTHVEDNVVAPFYSDGSYGGGIHGARLAIVSSTFTGNVTGGVGNYFEGYGTYFGRGAAVSSTEALWLVNSTIADNRGGYDGSVHIAGTGRVIGTTLTGNDVTRGGTAGIAVAEGGSLALANSILAGNGSDGSAPAVVSLVQGAPLGLYGTNILTDRFEGFGLPTSGNGSSVLLPDSGRATLELLFDAVDPAAGTGVLSGVVADNGGLVPTAALAPGLANPALDAGDPEAPVGLDEAGLGLDVNEDGDLFDTIIATASGNPYDGRGPGFDRLVDLPALPGLIDVGAFELVPSEAPSLLVTTAADSVATDGQTSLREAVAAVADGSFPAGATITFDAGVFDGAPEDVIRLVSGPIALPVSLAIDGDLDGDGTPDVVISGDAAGDDAAGADAVTDLAASAGRLADNSRLLASDPGTEIVLEGLVLTGGRSTADSADPGADFAAFGGAVHAGGSLTLRASRVEGNETTGAGAGGGGLFAAGDILLVESTVADNRALGDFAAGGGLHVRGRLEASGGEIADNVASGAGGGGVVVGDVDLEGMSVARNRTEGPAADGGGLSARDATVRLVDSTIAGNRTLGDFAEGGGVSAGDVFATRSTIELNATSGSNSTGGGIDASGGTVVLVDSHVFDNMTTGFNAGGGGVQATLLGVFESTIAGNVTADIYTFGGGVRASTAVLANATVAGNATSGQGSGGGGLSVGDAVLVNSTVTGNSVTGADADGGGLHVTDATLVNSLVTGNFAGDPAREAEIGRQDPGGTIAFEGANLVGADASAFDASVSPNVANAASAEVFADTATTFNGVVVGRLGDNGGPVPTVALLADPANPAVDAGVGGVGLSVVERGSIDLNDNGVLNETLAITEALFGFDFTGDGDLDDTLATTSDLATDARGVARPLAPFGGPAAPDLGAVELRAPEAPSLEVTTAADRVDPFDGETSLREAVAAVNAGAFPAGSTVTFDAGVFAGGATIRLTDGEIAVTAPLVIDGDADGTGSSDVTITGDAAGDDTTRADGTTDIAASRGAGALDDNTRIFAIADPAAATTLANLVLTGGYTAADSGIIALENAGGAVRSAAQLALEGVKLIGNATAGDDSPGGAIFSERQVVLEATVIAHNLTAGARSEGGGLAGSNLVIAIDSRIEGNLTEGDFASGGGIDLLGDLELVRSAVIDNETRGARAEGGGVAVGSDLLMAGSTLAGNATTGVYAQGGGGWAANVDLVNATVFGNRTEGDDAEGGGLYILDGGPIRHATIVSNATYGALSHGGGLALGNGDITLADSIVLRNATLGTGAADELGPTANAGGFYGAGPVFAGLNIVGATPTGYDASVDPAVVNAAIGDVFLLPGPAPVLRETPGGVPTVPLARLSANPALDAAAAGLPQDVFDLDGDGDGLEPLPVDARGAPREITLLGGGADLGAHELRPETVSIAPLDAEVAEGDTAPGIASFRVTRGGEDPGQAALELSVSVGPGPTSPADGADFVFGAFPGFLADFAAGETVADLEVILSADETPEPDETFTVEVTSPTGLSEIVTGTATGTILNDDAPAQTLSISDAGAVGEGDAGTTPLVFSLTRTGDLGAELAVGVTLEGAGPAPADAADFGGALPTTIAVFAPGAPTATASFGIAGDGRIEPDEGVRAVISDAGGAAVADGEATATVLNDDMFGPVSGAVGQIRDTEFDETLLAGAGARFPSVAGANTFLVAETVPELATATFLGRPGDTVALVPGLEIAGTAVAGSTLFLDLASNARVEILGARDLSFATGTNPTTGETGEVRDFDGFVTQVLGLPAPETGVVRGGFVTAPEATAQASPTPVPGDPAGSSGQFRALSGDETLLLSAGTAHLGLGGADRYILSEALTPGSTAQVLDTGGVLDLVDGLEIAGFTLAGATMRLDLATGARLDLLGAPDFDFAVAGNPTTGEAGTVLDYEGFLDAVLGTAPPAMGERIDGGPVTIAPLPGPLGAEGGDALAWGDPLG